jgi:hypothetical protein
MPTSFAGALFHRPSLIAKRPHPRTVVGLFRIGYRQNAGQVAIGVDGQLSALR